MLYYKDIKFHNSCIYTTAGNLVIGDKLKMIGPMTPLKLTITEFNVVDIDYNHLYPQLLIFEFDTELYPINSKFWTANLNTEVKMDYRSASVLFYSSDPSEDIGGYYTNWSIKKEAKDIAIAEKVEWEKKQLLLKGE